MSRSHWFSVSSDDLATTTGLATLELELQLVLAEIYLRSSGNPNRLRALRDEARAKGFFWIEGRSLQILESFQG